MLKFRTADLVLFARFIAVGILNSAFGYGVYTILICFETMPEIALLVATVLGVIFNFFTTGRLAFKNSDNNLFVRFVAVYIVVYIGNASALRILVDSNMDPIVAQAALMPVSIIATFMLMRVWAFKDVKK